MANDFKYLTFEINKTYARVKLCGYEEIAIDINLGGGWFYMIYRKEVVKVENNLYYNHLDKIFVPCRKKPLDEEDLQLYSILNEGKKPTMYDFEF